MTGIFLVMAHPDDAFVWCGGLVLECIQLGAKVTIVSLSKAADRVEDAIKEIGVANNVKYLSFDRRKISESKICKLVTEASPEVIVTHWADDTHDYHREAACVTELCLKDYKLKQYDERMVPNLRVLQCDTYYSLGQNGIPFPGKTIIDISNNYAKKMKIVKAICGKYLPLIERMVRIQNAFYGGKIGSKFAEAFLESSSLASIGGGLGMTTAKNLLEMGQRQRLLRRKDKEHSPHE
jgi:hypothetical protein